MPKRDLQSGASSANNSTQKKIKRDSDICNLNLDQVEKQLQETKEEIRDIPTLVESLTKSFPLQLSDKDIRLKSDSCQPVPHGFRFSGKYNRLPIQCTCVNTDNQELIDHEWKISQLLVVCRNMGTYIGRYQSTPKEANIRLPDVSLRTELWFFVEQVYQYNTLTEYLEAHQSEGTGVEPLYFIQMGIALYSMLVDAHALDIGLVNITEESLRVGIDGGLYFVGFRDCVHLNQETPLKNKSWIIKPKAKTPEFALLKKGQYKKEMDVYLASLVLGKIAHKNCSDQHYKSFYKEILKQLASGLQQSYQERASAEDMLKSFEELRYKALNIKCEAST